MRSGSRRSGCRCAPTPTGHRRRVSCPCAGPKVNLVPAQYREVSVTEVPVPLDEGALHGYLTGRAVYRRTRYVIARNGAASMVAEVSKETEQPLFSPVTAVTVLARAEETAMIDVRDV